VSALPLQQEFEVYTRQFPWRQKLRLIGEILRVYVRVRWSLGRNGSSEILSELRERREAPTGQDDLGHQLAGHRLGRVVMRVLNVLPSDSPCLIRSLVLIELLEKRGIRSSLVIGVAPAPEFAAHAWVEIGGVPLLPALESQFSRLVEL
jgi:hypothetical protein